jgi:hypothetical protein
MTDEVRLCPPNWVTVIHFVHDNVYNVRVEHGRRHIDFTASGMINKQDLLEVCLQHKKRMIDDENTAIRVAEKLKS